MTRDVLPERRAVETFDLWHDSMSFTVSIGFYDDGRPGEVFVTGTKAGSGVEAVSRDGAILISLALQHGVPVDVIRHAVTRTAGDEPSSIIGAVVDRLARCRPEDPATAIETGGDHPIGGDSGAAAVQEVVT